MPWIQFIVDFAQTCFIFWLISKVTERQRWDLRVENQVGKSAKDIDILTSAMKRMNKAIKYLIELKEKD